jgi:predicted acetyltransferase
MEIRQLDQSGLPKLEALYRNAYRIDSATSRGWSAGIDVRNTRAIADADRVLSVIQIIPYTVDIGGREMSMGGIGGVATWADQQGKGFAGKLMGYSVGEMRRLGNAVSFLYPFSYRYYGKFGWEIAARRRVYTNFTQRDLPRSRESGRVRAVVTDADFALLRRVYEPFAKQYNGMVVRGEREWNAKRAQMGNDRFQFYLIDGDTPDEPAGYFSCEEKPVEGGYETIVREVVCLSDAAYRAMFAFLAVLPGNVKKITVGAPEAPCLFPYFTEPFVECRVNASFQARVVDLEQACLARGWREGVSGCVTFAIRDEHGPWNEGAWRLEVADGKAVIGKAASAEIELTIQQFSGIYLGFHDPVLWVGQGALPRSAADAAAVLKSLFLDKPTNLLDFF